MQWSLQRKDPAADPRARPAMQASSELMFAWLLVLGTAPTATVAGVAMMV